LAVVGWRRAVIPLAIAGTLASAAGAQASRLLIIDGAGDGHGVGMSQTGAQGYALHGYSALQILAHYYTGTAVGQIAPRRTVSVLLQSGLRSVVFQGAVRAGTRRLGVGAAYLATASRTPGVIVLESERGRVLARLPSPLTIGSPAPITLDGAAQNRVVDGRYRGSLRIIARARGLEVVNVVGLESYVRGVVPVESPPNWAPAELQAQAIAARSYAIASTAASADFDLYAGSQSQQYGGVAAETPTTNAAVAATAGEVVTYGGTPVTTYYFASSGGETEDIQNAFPGAAAQPWLLGVLDPFDHSRFGPMKLTLHGAARRLRGLLQGRLERIVVLRRGVSPRILTAEIVGSTGTTTVSGPTLAAAFGLPSSWACFAVTPASGAPVAGWDRPCEQTPTGITGPSGPTGPSGATGSSGGGAVAPGGSTGTSGTTAASGPSGSSGGGAIAPGG
jgi:stage II sporulation protein D